jgi:hypothetical protein
MELEAVANPEIVFASGPLGAETVISMCVVSHL